MGTVGVSNGGDRIVEVPKAHSWGDAPIRWNTHETYKQTRRGYLNHLLWGEDRDNSDLLLDLLLDPYYVWHKEGLRKVTYELRQAIYSKPNGSWTLPPPKAYTDRAIAQAYADRVMHHAYAIPREPNRRAAVLAVLTLLHHNIKTPDVIREILKSLLNMDVIKIVDEYMGLHTAAYIIRDCQRAVNSLQHRRPASGRGRKRHAKCMACVAK